MGGGDWICQVFSIKKWRILIKKESKSLVFTSLEIPRDYFTYKDVKRKVQIRRGSYESNKELIERVIIELNDILFIDDS